jgi:hypothetical protein
MSYDAGGYLIGLLIGLILLLIIGLFSGRPKKDEELGKSKEEEKCHQR